MKVLIRNATRGTVIAGAADVADTSEKRREGLLKRAGLAPGEGLWIKPCESVHSFFMKFAIDLIYIDKKKTVRKVVRNMVPWRASVCFSAHSIIELPVGAIDASRTERGDQVEIDQI